eukprot:Trichotokara_eunicae@DN6330_c1_g1_i5.p1
MVRRWMCRTIPPEHSKSMEMRISLLKNKRKPSGKPSPFMRGRNFTEVGDDEDQRDLAEGGDDKEFAPMSSLNKMGNKKRKKFAHKKVNRKRKKFAHKKVNKKLKKIAPMASLDEMVNALGHNGREITLLKIDCEGSEYANFAAFLGENSKLWPKVDQLQLEIHNKNKKQNLYVGLLDIIENDLQMSMFHRECNLIAGCRPVEVAYVRKDFNTSDNTLESMGGIPQQIH